MAWETLKTDYTDAIWVGKKRYNQITNNDGTVSFDDVTDYAQKENSFYGADDANSTNEAINYIMKALENDTDLYTTFKTYFEGQKTAFSSTGENMMRDLQAGYQARIEAYESKQEDNFEAWLNTIKTKIDATDVASLQNDIDALTVSSKVTLTDNGSTSDYAKTYTIKQGETSIGTINIPKDLVVTSGSVVKNPTSALTGTYIKLVIANQTDPLYINVADLCDVYTGGTTATVKVAVSSTNQITATIVNGSVSKAMLDSSVQTTLSQVATNKTNIATNATNISTIKADLGTYPVKYTETDTVPSTGKTLNAIIGYLKKQVTSLISKVATNTTNIADLNSYINYVQGLVNTNSSSIKELNAIMQRGTIPYVTRNSKSYFDFDAIANKSPNNGIWVFDGVYRNIQLSLSATSTIDTGDWPIVFHFEYCGVVYQYLTCIFQGMFFRYYRSKEGWTYWRRISN